MNITEDKRPLAELTRVEVGRQWPWTRGSSGVVAVYLDPLIPHSEGYGASKASSGHVGSEDAQGDFQAMLSAHPLSENASTGI